jgi:anti-anti-sigma factor
MSREGKILVAENDATCIIKLVGDVRVTLCMTIDEYIESIFSSSKQWSAVVVDLLELDEIDSTTLGLLAKLAIYARDKFSVRPTIFSTDESILKLIKCTGFEQLFDIQMLENSGSENLEFQDLATRSEEDTEEVKKRVLEAHRVLMAMNAKNEEDFRELVENLEKGN